MTPAPDPISVPTPIPLALGTVMRSAGGVYEVDVPTEGAGREPVLCTPSGKLKKGRQQMAQPVFVGDQVRLRFLETSGPDARGRILREGSIEEVLPRTTQLARSRQHKKVQVTMTNLDQVVIVMAAREPDVNTHRLDRFLVLAEANDLRAVICLNKIDLVDHRAMRKDIDPVLKQYRSLGYPVLLTSAERGKERGATELRAELKDRITAFIGSSGVGKSSLVMLIQENLMLWVGDVMDIGKGRHTTTDVTLFPLDEGGYLADTPGVKTVTLLERDEINIEQCFPEFRAFLGKCKLNDAPTGLSRTARSWRPRRRGRSRNHGTRVICGCGRNRTRRNHGMGCRGGGSGWFGMRRRETRRYVFRSKPKAPIRHTRPSENWRFSA